MHNVLWSRWTNLFAPIFNAHLISDQWDSVVCHRERYDTDGIDSQFVLTVNKLIPINFLSWQTDTRNSKWTLILEEPSSVLETFESQTAGASVEPDSYQRPKDFVDLYSPPLYQLSYQRLVHVLKEKRTQRDIHKPAVHLCACHHAFPAWKRLLFFCSHLCVQPA